MRINSARRPLVVSAIIALLAGCAPSRQVIVDEGYPAPLPATRPDIPAPPSVADPAWPIVSAALQRPGKLHDGVYSITIPRDDLDVALDGMAIPTAAGIESVFNFYRCPCGKMNVAGQFVVADYEANDVMDALRHEAVLNVASIAPMFLYDKPRIMLIRFQGEGDPAAMAKALREALRWTGRERMAPDNSFKAGPETRK